MKPGTRQDCKLPLQLRGGWERLGSCPLPIPIPLSSSTGLMLEASQPFDKLGDGKRGLISEEMGRRESLTSHLGLGIPSPHRGCYLGDWQSSP